VTGCSRSVGTIENSSQSTSSESAWLGSDPERAEHGAIEAFGRGEIRDGDFDVVEHPAETTVAVMLELDIRTAPRGAQVGQPRLVFRRGRVNRH